MLFLKFLSSVLLALEWSCSVRVSNELGAGNPHAARLAVCVVVVIAVIESILVGAVVILIRNIWGYAYSNEEEVVKYAANMMPLLAVTAILDGMAAVLSGFSLSSVTIDLWSL